MTDQRNSAHHHPRPETEGTGVLLDHAIYGVAIAADAAEDEENGRPWFRAVCLDGRRAWAADRHRLHVADLPRNSAPVDPPLWVHGMDLMCVLQELPQWLPGGQPVASITGVSDRHVTVSLPAETAGPTGELRVKVRRIDDAQGRAGFSEMGPVRDFGPSPAAVTAVQAKYLRDALEAVAGNLASDHPVTVMIYHRPPGIVLLTEVNGRQRAALVAPLAVLGVRPWWWPQGA